MEDEKYRGHLDGIKHFYAMKKCGPELSDEDESLFLNLLGWLITDYERATTELRECREEFYAYQKEPQ